MTHLVRRPLAAAASAAAGCRRLVSSSSSAFSLVSSRSVFSSSSSSSPSSLSSCGMMETSDEGEPGRDRPVRPTDWRTSPLPMKYTTLRLDAAYTPAQMGRISMGIMPQEMEDKWFVYMQDRVLHMHRSWTGFCVYRVNFVEEDGEYRIISADVNRDPDQYLNVSDEHDKQLIPFLIDTLFGVGTSPYPTAREVNANRLEDGD